MAWPEKVSNVVRVTPTKEIIRALYKALSIVFQYKINDQVRFFKEVLLQNVI